MRSVSILGSTGSVGRSTLAVVDAFPDALRVVGLAAGGNLDLLAEQVERYAPELVSVRSPADVGALRARLTRNVEIVCGADAVASMTSADVVIAAIGGAAGIPPVHAALEAHHLFAMPPERIDILIHPQSIVHSMVEYIDGSIVAQLSTTDMKFPIQYALLYPERVTAPFARLDLAKIHTLDFLEVDARR